MVVVGESVPSAQQRLPIAPQLTDYLIHVIVMAPVEFGETYYHRPLLIFAVCGASWKIMSSAAPLTAAGRGAATRPGTPGAG